MAPKWFIWVNIFIFSAIGGYLPVLWGGGAFSFASVLLGGIGGIVGVFVAVKIGNSI